MKKVLLEIWCFPANFAKFLSSPFFIEHLRWLLLLIQLQDEYEAISLRKNVSQYHVPALF